jgi:lipopolysaccharide/colanic/teichoic acid biosynthesis glycosyltransferase
MDNEHRSVASTAPSSADGAAGAPRRFDFSPWVRRQWGQDPVERASKPVLVSTPTWERIAAIPLLMSVAPLMAIVVAAIKLESARAPVFYRQIRVGVDRRRRPSDPVAATRLADGEDRRRTPGEGRMFKIWKFRTMVPDAEVATGPVWASDHDPRVTRVGRVLRHLRLDELPQLINVVQGDMRLIGPRPERPEFVQRLNRDIPEYRRRMEVLPGITGLAQVKRSYDASVDDVQTKIRYDIFYVDHRCRLLDLKILVKTIDVVVRGHGAR